MPAVMIHETHEIIIELMECTYFLQSVLCYRFLYSFSLVHKFRTIFLELPSMKFFLETFRSFLWLV